MRGKEAARSANRRHAEAVASAEELRGRLQRLESAYQKRIVDLETEIRRLRTEHRAEASRIAAEEVHRRMAEAERERRARGLSDDVAMNLMLKKDKFVMNACRYLSMKEGLPPRAVLPRVMAWMTDKDFYGFDNAQMLVELGVDANGWLVRNIRADKHWERMLASRNRRKGKPEAFSLDYAEDHRDDFEIHPNYNPSWYPRVEHGGIVLVDDIERALGVQEAEIQASVDGETPP